MVADGEQPSLYMQLRTEAFLRAVKLLRKVLDYLSLLHFLPRIIGSVSDWYQDGLLYRTV